MPLAEHDVAFVAVSALAAVSIHVPLAEHDMERTQTPGKPRVSIHVPLAEHDVANAPTLEEVAVSIHVPLAEHDLICCGTSSRYLRFQFTCPSRSTTWTKCQGTGHPPRFNSRAPRGARPFTGAGKHGRGQFQFTCPSRSTTSCRKYDASTIKRA